VIYLDDHRRQPSRVAETARPLVKKVPADISRFSPTGSGA
jgi:hypothetical protein